MNRILWGGMFICGCVTDVAPVADGGRDTDAATDGEVAVMRTFDGGATLDGAPGDALAVEGDTGALDGTTTLDATPLDATPADMAGPPTLYDPLPVCVNEFSPKVSGYGADFPLDWIELFNPTEADVGLEGWAISDNRETADKHVFGPEIVIPAYGAVQLFADGQPERGPDHLAFRLSAGGEEIVLTAPDGRGRIVEFDKMPIDVTPARIPDCCVEPDCWQMGFLGSPGRPNAVAIEEVSTLVDANAEWLYFIGPRPEDWTGVDFDDAAWGAGNGPLGWGDGHIVTVLPREQGVLAVYFRRHFLVPDVAGVETLTFTLLVDDGAVVYLNGEEVLREGMPGGEIGPETLATRTAGGEGETARTPYVIPHERLIAGRNVIAVEVHQAAPNSSDLGFDGALEMRRTESAAPAALAPPGFEQVVVETVPLPADFTEWIFAKDMVHRVEIELTPAGVGALEAQPKTYTPGALIFDGRRVPQSGIRLRGTADSFRPLGDKPKLRLDFNQFADGRTFYGLESLALNNSVEDCSRMKEVMAYGVFTEAGLPAPRAAYAHLFVNGEDYGLYVLVETEDDVWLDRHYDEPNGNLYDGKYIFVEGADGVFLDFERALVPRFQLDEGDDVGHADLLTVAVAIETNAGQPSFYDAVGEVVDWDAFHRHAAAEIWTGHIDGYLSNRNNYRVYFDPDDEKMDFATWDLDWTFGGPDELGCGFAEPCGLLAQRCWADAGCLAAQRDAVIALSDHLDTVGLVAQFDALAGLTREVALATPRDACTAEQTQATRAAVRTWLEVQGDELRLGWAP